MENDRLLFALLFCPVCQFQKKKLSEASNLFVFQPPTFFRGIRGIDTQSQSISKHRTLKKTFRRMGLLMCSVKYVNHGYDSEIHPRKKRKSNTKAHLVSQQVKG